MALDMLSFFQLLTHFSNVVTEGWKVKHKKIKSTFINSAPIHITFYLKCRYPFQHYAADFSLLREKKTCDFLLEPTLWYYWGLLNVGGGKGGRHFSLNPRWRCFGKWSKSWVSMMSFQLTHSIKKRTWDLASFRPPVVIRASTEPTAGRNFVKLK